MNLEWDRLKVFYYVAKEKSITRAAERLRMFQPSVTRSIQQLEHQANSKLFIRNRKGLILTQQREILFDHVKNMMTELELAKNQMSGKSEEVKGTLKITTTYSYASTFLSQHLCNFSKLYPDIKLHLMCDDTDFALVQRREIGVAFRTFDIHAQNLEQIFLHERTLQLFASEEYLREMGTPKEAKDLDGHKLITFDPPHTALKDALSAHWLLSFSRVCGHTSEPFMIVNSVECLAQMAEAGIGIIALSNYSSLIKKHRLIRVLPELNGPSSKMHYVYSKSIKNLRMVKLLGDYLKEMLSANDALHNIPYS